MTADTAVETALIILVIVTGDKQKHVKSYGFKDRTTIN